MFLKQFPTEVIVIICKPDNHPRNADTAFIAPKSKSQVVNLNKRDNSDLL
jgi:hypothetical protein